MSCTDVSSSTCCCSVPVHLAFGAYATQIRNARLWRSDDKLRLVFDLSGPVQYKTFSLTSPERLIIDLSGAGLSGIFLSWR